MNYSSHIHETSILSESISFFLVKDSINFPFQNAEHGMEWNRRRFFYIPYWLFSSISFPFRSKNLPFHILFHAKNFFHIPLHTSISRQV